MDKSQLKDHLIQGDIIDVAAQKVVQQKKQVERCHHDPTVLLITYSSDHNHHLPAAAATKHRLPTTTFAATRDIDSPANTAEDQSPVFTYQPDDDFSEIGAGELGWFSYVGPTLLESTSSAVGSTRVDDEVALMLPIGEEDQSLFGDLGELPECSSVVYRAV